MEKLTHRSQFLAVARGKRVNRAGFVLQALTSREAGPARFGFTVTKKVGNAVVRNRIRRRLREAVRVAGESEAAAGTDYVLVGRLAALTLEFDRLVADLLSGLASLSGRSQEKRPEREAR